VICQAREFAVLRFPQGSARRSTLLHFSLPVGAIALLKQTQQRKASFLRSFTRILRSRLYPEARELEREVNEENKLLYNNSLTTIREVSLLARSPPISPMKQLLNLIRALLASLKPGPTEPQIESYGQRVNDVPPEQARSVIQWLSASLLSAGYRGRSHLFWDDGNTDWEQAMMTAVMRSEPVFLYRLGERPSPPAPGCYWRLMGEHPSMRIYQLEARE
jgi:hypothetical protein